MINWCQVEANYTIKLIIIIEMKPPGYVSTEGRPTAPFAPLLPLMCSVKDYQLFPDMQAMLNMFYDVAKCTIERESAY